MGEGRDGEKSVRKLHDGPGTRPKEPKQGGENGGREYGAEKKGVCLRKKASDDAPSSLLSSESPTGRSIISTVQSGMDSEG